MKTLYLKLDQSKAPKHLKIYKAFVTAIKSGQIRSGDKIPSTRELAKLYHCNRLTVMNSMQSLVSEGWLENKERSYYSVSAKTPITDSESGLKTKRAKFSAQISRPKPDFDLERTRYRIEFWGGQPDLRLFPFEEFRKILSDSLKKVKPDQLNYGHIDGLDPLQKQMAEYLRRTRNLVDKEYIVTNGSQEALYLVSQIFIKPGDKVAIEKKGYPPAWRLFESLGAELIPIEVDEEGLNTENLARVLQKHKIKMIYTTPLHQYPTTVTLSPRRRQELIQLAEKYRIPILEDDYDHEFHYLSPPPAPISTETEYGIYICSFSKILFPGARLGTIACNPELKEHIVYQKYLVTRQTDCLSQLALAHWIKDGGFERHLRRTRRAYEKRYFYMLEKLKELQLEQQISWTQPNGGMSIWVNLHRDSQIVADHAKKLGIMFQPETSMDYKNHPGSHLRIGFAGVNENEIRDGFSILKQILSK